MSAQASIDYSFKPEQYLKVLDELEVAARDDSVFVPEEYTKREAQYVRAYVSRRYNEHMEEYCLPGIAAMRTYLQDEEKPAESKEFDTLIYFKHRARSFEHTANAVSFLITQRYYPEDLMDENANSDYEDDEERWERRRYLDEDGQPLPAPPSTDPVETDPQWEDINDYVREYALTAYCQKIGQLIGICKGAECGIRSNQRTRQEREARARRGVKQIMKREGNRYTIREIPIADPMPEGFSAYD